MDEANREYKLEWHHHDTKVSETLYRAWEEKQFLDVTLVSGNRQVGAHKVVLCACSPFFESLLMSESSDLGRHSHPMLFFHDIPFESLYAVVQYMYRGWMTVTQQNVTGHLHAAKTLQVRELFNGNNGFDGQVDSPPDSSGGEPLSTQQQLAVKRKRSQDDDEEEEDREMEEEYTAPPSPDYVNKEEAQSEEDYQEREALMPPNPMPMPSTASKGSPVAHCDPQELLQHQKHQLAIASYLAMAQQATPLSSKNPSSGPIQPVLRSRLVWDPAHIVILESWYVRETRYPSVPQAQNYANILSKTQPTDPSGKIKVPINVTAQNVSHWFQNRRRKDNHPEIEEKRVKKRSAKQKKGSPLDLTQQPTFDITQHPMSSSYQPHLNISQAMQHHRGDSDEDGGLQYHSDRFKSEVDNDDER